MDDDQSIVEMLVIVKFTGKTVHEREREREREREWVCLPLRIIPAIKNPPRYWLD